MLPAERFPAELNLVVDAVRCALGGDVDVLRARAEQIRDWDLTIEIARWHRQDAFLFDALDHLGSRIPPKHRQELENGYRAAAAGNLVLVGVLTAVARALDAAEIPFLTLKGPALARDYYGDLVHRRSRDIDIVVAPADVGPAMAVLASQGFRPEIDYTPGQLKLLLRSDKEIKLYAGEVLLELHWGFAHIDALFPRSVVEGVPSDRSEIGGLQIPVLDAHTRLAYLAFHAARHFWFRLFWLADFAFYLKRVPRVDWDGMFDRARALGQGHTLCFSMVMAQRVFGAEIDASVIRRWARQPVFEDHADELVATWATKPVAGQAYRIPDPVTRTYRWLWRMYPRHRGVILRRVLFHPTIHDVLAMPLPAWLYPLYFLIRPFRLLFRVFRGR